MTAKNRRRRFRVSAVARTDFPGFRRAGQLFPNAPAYLELDTIDESVRNEPMLLVVEADDETKPTD